MSNELICRLCQKRKVGNQYSHIVPKFFTKSIYFKKDKNILGVTTRVSKDGIFGQIEERPKQDMLKEKDLFCSECEIFFGILDTHFCNKIYKRLRKPSKEDFIFFRLRNTMASCEIANEKIVLLFVASLLARFHLSSLDFCRNYKLDNDDYIFIQNLLNETSSQNLSELLLKCDKLSKQDSFSYLLLSYSNNSNIDSNFSFVESCYQSGNGVYYFIINDFVFVVYSKEVDYTFPEAINNGLEKVRIVFLSDDNFEVVRKLNLNAYFNQIKTADLRKK